ncbi:MAG TPA: NAD(P)H-hydrate dehydratase [Anaerolineae bacterium]
MSNPVYIVTTHQMQAAEKAADASGLSYEQMMENAGRAVAQAIETQYDLTGVGILVLVGPGNNGGDGLVVARHLAQAGAVVAGYVWQRETEGDKNWTLLDETRVERVRGEDDADRSRLAQLLDQSAIFIDALLGTGVSRPISGSLAELLEQVKTVVTARRGPQTQELIEPARPAVSDEVGPVIVAVDVPSGLNSDTGEVDPYTLSADLTVTLAAAKRGHILMPGPEVVGQLVVGDIGLKANHYPDDVKLELATPAMVAAMLPARPVNAHKGTFGTAMLVAGSINYTGAALLAARSALRVGAGLVRLAPPQVIYPILASRLAEVTYLPLPHAEGGLAPEAARVIRDNLARVKALLIGPGLGQANSTISFLLDLLTGKTAGKRSLMGFRRSDPVDSADDADGLPPLVLDADALNILAQQEAWWQLLPVDSILTPHPGEMARLMDSTVKEVQASRLDVAVDMAAKWNQIVLLKGAHTVIAAPDGRTTVMPFANPALAKAGSGDILAGAIVGLLAQGLGPFDAAVAGAYLHGLAGELTRENIGVTAAMAGDLIGFLPVAIREVTGE